jgi:hypothetical protein
VRSRIEAALRLAALAALLARPSAGAQAVEPPSARRIEPATPTRADVARAIERVSADPNLATERTIRTLRWRTSGDKPKPGAWVAWLGGLFRWLEQSARVLVWCAAVLLAGFLVVSCLRMVQSYRASRDEDPFIAPTHVRDLDIRPETLPPDVGAAARALWDRAERRAALALLYRGLLSRLAHVHRVAIRDSTTEGDCLALTATLTPARQAYASQLVGAWTRLTYGCLDVPAAVVHDLCDRFAPALDADRPSDSVAPGGAV